MKQQTITIENARKKAFEIRKDWCWQKTS